MGRQRISEEVQRFGRELSEVERRTVKIGTPEEETADIPSPIVPGVYDVMIRLYGPKRRIDTQLPAGPAAEAAAIQKYKDDLSIFRMDLKPEITLVKE